MSADAAPKSPQDVAAIIAAVAADDPTVTSIDLGNKILGGKLKELCTALAQNTYVTIVNLEADDIRDTGVEELASALRTNDTITTLILRDNAITDEGLRPLCNVLQSHPSVTALDLSFNDITSEGVRAIAYLLRANISMTHLTLGCNQIGNEGVRQIVTAIQENPESMLSNLTLDNNGITEAGAKSLAALIAKSNRLTDVELQDNRIGDAGAQALGEALKSSPSLVNLDLRNNYIGDDGLCLVAVCVAMNKGSVKKLDVRNNNGTARADRALTGAKTNKPALDLRWREGDDGPPVVVVVVKPTDKLPTEPAERLQYVVAPPADAPVLNADDFCEILDQYITPIMDWSTSISADMPLVDLPPHFAAVLKNLKTLTEFIKTPPAQLTGGPATRFGVRRMRATDLIVCCAEKRILLFDEALISEGTIGVLLDNFFAFPVNNILHCAVFRLLGGSLRAPENLMAEFLKFNILDRLVEAEDQARQSKGAYCNVGHIVTFSNAMNAASVAIAALRTATDGNTKWKEFTDGPLAELNKRNETLIGGVPPVRAVVEERPQSGALGSLFSALGLFNFMK
eukprot:TRINITY_DN5537_c0_g1_i1.p1 TRINITY_DN5537_c0_g1~~TRINITY_DN5537_c0_g1_i1.p1  ORF type:complete len:570 (-),score=133.12 TRINITY_DN5537_c0_g1_i1:22-1731(-)